MELVVILRIWSSMRGENGIDDEMINFWRRDSKMIKVSDQYRELLSKRLDKDSLF